METHIRLEAINPARKAFRRYEIGVSADLFGWYIVELTNGRIGTIGRTRRFSVRHAAEAQTIVDQALKRRRGAGSRIGVEYQVIH